MTRYAAFLRGINVSGRRVSGADLCACFDKAGMRAVAAFLASGNMVFEDVLADRSVPALTLLLEEQLQASLGFAVPVFLRDREEIRAITTYQPFVADLTAASAGKLQVALLRDAPSPGARQRVLAAATAEDLLAVEGRELYWLSVSRSSGGERRSTTGGVGCRGVSGAAACHRATHMRWYRGRRETVIG